MAQPDKRLENLKHGLRNSEEETKEILSSFRSIPEMEHGIRMVDREEYVRQNLEKLEEQKERLLSNNTETLLTIFLHKCMVGERSVNDLRKVGEAECLMRVIEQKMKAVKDRIKEIGKGKMVMGDKAEDGSEHDSDLKSLCNAEMNGYCCVVNGAKSNDDLFWSCVDNPDGGLLDVIQKPCFNVDQRSPWMETVMAGGDCNLAYETDDDFISGFKSNGNGGLEKLFQQQYFDEGQSSSLMGPSSDRVYFQVSWIYWSYLEFQKTGWSLPGRIGVYYLLPLYMLS